MKLPTIPHDKAQHFIYGAVIALVVAWAALFWGLADHIAKASGFVAAIVVGAIKEYVLDRRANQLAAADGAPNPNTVSHGDVIATALGGLLVWLA